MFSFDVRQPAFSTIYLKVYQFLAKFKKETVTFVAYQITTRVCMSASGLFILPDSIVS